MKRIIAVALLSIVAQVATAADVVTNKFIGTESVSQNVIKHNANIVQINAGFAAGATATNQLNANLAGQSAQLADNAAVLQSHTTQLGQHASQMAMQRTEVDDLQGQMDWATGQLEAAENSVAVLQTAAAGTLANIQALQANDSSIATAVNAQALKVQALEARPVVDLQPLTTTVSGHTTQIAALQSRPVVDIAPLTARVVTLEARPIVDLQPLTAQVSALNATVATLPTVAYVKSQRPGNDPTIAAMQPLGVLGTLTQLITRQNELLAALQAMK